MILFAEVIILIADDLFLLIGFINVNVASIFLNDSEISLSADLRFLNEQRIFSFGVWGILFGFCSQIFLILQMMMEVFF